ncbi:MULTISPECIES: META domain-containing protein [Arthrobacter]|uniref:META domain-containing protein n=1 Tax=unclassified Arthrobacter TaxID=235627 RepID=UPI0024BA1E86|nr:META domain-containing protein [Arthrobacter sp. H35-MC1]MDJ0316592.1 META domain-containing protein [Arthrobacter sp. H35-MC1]
MKRFAALAGSLLLALTISSCGAATGPVGTWGDGYNTDKLPYLELALGQEQDDNKAGFLSGSDGCNRLTGQWLMVDGELTFPQMGSTMMACQGIDTWLSKAAGATLDGDVLTVKDATGVTLGTLERRN